MLTKTYYMTIRARIYRLQKLLNMLTFFFLTNFNFLTSEYKHKLCFISMLQLSVTSIFQKETIGGRMQQTSLFFVHAATQ